MFFAFTAFVIFATAKSDFRSLVRLQAALQKLEGSADGCDVLSCEGEDGKVYTLKTCLDGVQGSATMSCGNGGKTMTYGLLNGPATCYTNFCSIGQEVVNAQFQTCIGPDACPKETCTTSFMGSDDGCEFSLAFKQ